MKTFFLLMALSSVAMADCRVSDVLPTVRPGAQWTMQSQDTSTLVWLSTQTIPSVTEIQAAIQACQTNAAARSALKAQARLDVRNTSLTPAQRVQALLVLLDLDQ